MSGIIKSLDAIKEQLPVADLNLNFDLHICDYAAKAVQNVVKTRTN